MVPSTKSEELLGLIGGLYEAVLDASLWPGTAQRIARALGSTSAVLKTYDESGDVDLLQLTDNMVIAPKDQSWAEYWHRHDLWVERSKAFGEGRVVVGHDLVAPDELEASGYYQDWLRRLDIHHMVGGVFSLGDGALGVLGVHRDRSGPAYMDGDSDAVALLLPHLQRALKLRAALSPISPGGAYAALECCPFGVVVVSGARRRVVYANSAAEALLRNGGGLRVRAGRLVASEAAVENQLSDALGQALRQARGIPTLLPAAFQIARVGLWPLTVFTMPLRTELVASPEPAVVVFIRDPAAGGPSRSILRQMFGLTGSEADVAIGLSHGKALQRIADESRVGVSTVRTHLKSIMLKTHTSRQAELVALLLRSVGTF